MSILLMIAMLIFTYVGFHFLAAVSTSLIPATAFLFHSNGIAVTIFSLSLFCGFPILICLPMAIIAGALFSDIWYIPVLQYATLEIMLAILSIIATLIFGAGSSVAEILKRKK